MTTLERYRALASELAERARADATADFTDYDDSIRELLATAMGRSVAGDVLAGGVSTRLAASVLFHWVLTAKRIGGCEVQPFLEYCAGLTVDPPEVLPTNVHVFLTEADDWDEALSDDDRAYRALSALHRILDRCALLDTKFGRWCTADLAHVIVAHHDIHAHACPPSTCRLIRASFEHARANRTMRAWELEEFGKHLDRVCGRAT